MFGHCLLKRFCRLRSSVLLVCAEWTASEQPSPALSLVKSALFTIYHALVSALSLVFEPGSRQNM